MVSSLDIFNTFDRSVGSFNFLGANGSSFVWGLEDNEYNAIANSTKLATRCITGCSSKTHIFERQNFISWGTRSNFFISSNHFLSTLPLIAERKTSGSVLNKSGCSTIARSGRRVGNRSDINLSPSKKSVTFNPCLLNSSLWKRIKYLFRESISSLKARNAELPAGNAFSIRFKYVKSTS